jgi:DNA-binding transcriptional ArsR family regulator
MVISDLATLRVLSDPLRLQLLEAFGRLQGVPRTVKEVARELGETPTKLYYHVNLLEEQGILKVAESRLVSGIVEKRYVPSARSYRLDPELLRSAGGPAATGAATEAVAATVDGVFSATSRDIKRAFAAGSVMVGDDAPPDRRGVLSLTFLRLTPAHAAELGQRIRDLLSTEQDEGDPDAASYGLTVAFYRRPEEEGDTRGDE